MQALEPGALMPLAEIGSERQITAESLRQHYKKPPIQEVIFRVDAELPDQSRNPAVLARLAPYLNGFTLSHPIDESPDAQHAAAIVGQEFKSEQRGEIVRAQSDGFSFHKLHPYTSWEDWSPRAVDAFQKYRELVHPKVLTWCSVRYVNRIEIPKATELSDFFLTYPEIAPGIPQSVGGFFMQATIPHSRLGTFILLRQAMLPPDAPESAVIVLDLQVLSRLTGQETRDQTEAIASALHEIEIETFERCITNRTRELFQ